MADETLIELLKNASERASKLEQPNMSIPARPDYDSDILFSRAAEALAAKDAEIERLRKIAADLVEYASHQEGKPWGFATPLQRAVDIARAVLGEKR